MEEQEKFDSTLANIAGNAVTQGVSQFGGPNCPMKVTMAYGVQERTKNSTRNRIISAVRNVEDDGVLGTVTR